MSRTHTKFLMGCSALMMFCLGLLLTFAPGEVVRASGGFALPLLLITTQACGALYLGFAILNWMAKDNLIGGIYSRPVAMGNFLHFFAVAMALLRSFSSLPRSTGTYALLLIYVVMAAGFGSVLFGRPNLD